MVANVPLFTDTVPCTVHTDNNTSRTVKGTPYTRTESLTSIQKVMLRITQCKRQPDCIRVARIVVGAFGRSIGVQIEELLEEGVAGRRGLLVNL